MVPLSCFRSWPLLVMLAFVGAVQATELTTPEITAQGFDITDSQEGVLGEFGRIRVRFEVPDRIEKLYVKERSYDVDLAKTPEMTHFPLFGLKTQVRRLTDVTLNFQNYINEKIEAEGVYNFELKVTDSKGKSASAKLLVQVVAPPPVEPKFSSEAVETGAFRFVRVGASAVTGDDAFGITWRTIENNLVVIELTKQADGASRLIEITPSDYDEVRTRTQLAQKIAGGNEVLTLHLATVDGKAAGSVFGVINREATYLLKVTGSDTSISKHGTTVTLVGEYKR